MTGVDKDLATLLRRCIDQSRATYVPGTPEKYPAAELRGLSILDAERVEAELSRLERHPDAWSQEAFDQQKERAEAAEARLGEAHQECARLQQALARIRSMTQAWANDEPVSDDDRPFDSDADFLDAIDFVAAEALAGPGSEQSSLTESGPAGLPDTPAMGRIEEITVYAEGQKIGTTHRVIGGPDTPAFAGIPIVADPDMPEGTIELRKLDTPADSQEDKT